MFKKLEKKLKQRIGGEAVVTDLVEKVLSVLQDYDRLPQNPDLGFLRTYVEGQLTSEGLLRFVVFVCPKFDTSALFTNKPYEYFPNEAINWDLFEPRLRKIEQLRNELFKLGVVSVVEVIIGDNDFETYVLPFLDNISWDASKVSERKSQYLESFKNRLEKNFGLLFNIWSLSDLGIEISYQDLDVVEEQLALEVTFFKWLFSEEGPYKGKLIFSDDELTEMARVKFQAYGAQGEFLTELGGILLQTEGPGVWLLRTQMFRCTGAKTVPVIYPWIRREEIKMIKKGE